MLPRQVLCACDRALALLTLRAACLFALLLLAQAAVAQTWETVDDFQCVAGNNSWNLGLVVAPSGTVFASGLGSGCGALVVASQDDGTTWSGPLDDYSPAPPIIGSQRGTAGIACDSTGTLYVGVRTSGGATTLTAPSHWVVRQGTSGGTSWRTVDDYTFIGSSIETEPYGITTDGAGNVYVAGQVSYTNGTSAWVVRKGVAGTSFTTVDSFSGYGYGIAEAVFAHPTAGIFAVGAAYAPDVHKRATSTWIVRRSQNGGATWSTVDTYRLASLNFAIATCIGADSQGNLYVVGHANGPYGNAGYAHWIVRKSADGGSTWSTVDDFQLSSTTPTIATGFAADSTGNLFVAGYAESSTLGRIWIVRENPGGSATWTTVDNFQYQGFNSWALAIAPDSLGNVFVGGQGGGNWIVRKN